MPRTQYTDEDKAKALATLATNGGNVAQTANQTGIPRKTISNWANAEKSEKATQGQSATSGQVPPATVAEVALVADDELATLTDRQRRFIEEYLQCLNASEAARRAGYTGEANVVGPRVLANVGIRRIVDARLAEMTLPASEILTRLTEQATASIADFIAIDPDGSMRLDLATAHANGKLRLVKALVPTPAGIKLELYDAQAALVHLGKHHGLWKERHIHTGEDGGPIRVIAAKDLTDDELAAIAQTSGSGAAAAPSSPD
jgi:phage terminase small subunit